MKKYKICKAILVILAVFLCVVFYELLGICIAYKKQPEVSDTTRKETKNESWNERSENTERAVIIEKNPYDPQIGTGVLCPKIIFCKLVYHFPAFDNLSRKRCLFLHALSPFPSIDSFGACVSV